MESMNVRVVHFLNQYFGGLGGEEKAGSAIELREETVGPGRALQAILGHKAKLIATLVSGDNYFNENIDAAIPRVVNIVKGLSPSIFVAGPAFNAGRYGTACVEACNAVSEELGIPSVAAMHVENPGVDIYRRYKNEKVFVFPTAETVAGMQESLRTIAAFVSKLASCAPPGSAALEGYIPRGIRRLKAGLEQTGAERGVAMLLAKLKGEPFTSEIPVQTLETVPPPAPIKDLATATIAIVTTSGVVAEGNPDGLKLGRETRWAKYPIQGLHSMTESRWTVVHRGYHTAYMHSNPNYGVPVDALTNLSNAGSLRRVYPWYYVTVGAGGEFAAMKQIGGEIARELASAGVDGVLLVAT
ncbi:MAG: glycine/betaine/sarcosine/D-proline family reductase selenoprotein B [Deltaproteobacteria bacterium]|nr:glycine/betaine/sarcosine/D-proline family reductase selenoprotein B [Deltaproteobacteria bacterium]